MEMIHRLLREDEGVSLAEEGLLIALIALVCIVALTAVGTSLQVIFTTISGALGAAA